MEQTKKIITLNVAHAANLAPTVLSSNFPIEDGYRIATGMIVVAQDNHNKYDVGINDHSNNTKVDLADHTIFAAGSNGSDRFVPVEIPLSGNKLLVQTNIRQQVNEAIAYQVILQIEK